MSALLTNQELGIPKNATKAEREAALAKVYQEYFALMSKKPTPQEKEHGTKH